MKTTNHWRMLAGALLAVVGVWPHAALPHAAAAPSGIIARRAANHVAVGGDHGCALDTSGHTYCWGDNTYGQLGDGSTQQASLPRPIVADPGVQLAAGLDFSCVLTSQGTVQCWGHNNYGQLGDGSSLDRSSPDDVTGLAYIAAISAGAYHACALHVGGQVICWGNNTYGELGRGGIGGFSTAADPVPGLYGVVALSLGYNHSCALKDDGSVWCWGRNADGQLGTGGNADSATPVRVALPTRASVIAAGGYHTCALGTQGVVYCWGNNQHGELGSGSLSPSSRNAPQPVTGLSGPVRQLASGGSHSCAVEASGRTLCWGRNDWKQLGNRIAGDLAVPTPVEVLGLPDRPAQLALGAQHSCALDAVGALSCWGRNQSGELGNGKADSFAGAPDGVHGFASLDAIAISIGVGLHSCAVTAQGSAACWGDNSHGQLGDDTTVQRNFPATVFNTAGFGPVTSLAAGVSHSCALHVAASTRVSCWGSNGSGQLGNGGTVDSPRPVEVNALADTSALSAGFDFSCALSTSGVVQCWGSNVSGDLGDGTGVDSPVPVQALGIADAVRLASGGSHSCAVLVTGHVKCWGSNHYGQLGDGSVLDRLAPVEVAGLSTAVDVTAGEDHTCALLASGAIDCWGSNAGGQLGTGDTQDSLTPRPVQQLGSPATALDAGALHTCAVLASGEVKCWGRNDNGQLGNFSFDRALLPVRMEGLYGAPLQVAAGDVHTCVLLQSGTIQCAGRNAEGELGTGEAGPDMVYAVPTSYQGQSADYALPATLGPNATLQLAGHTSTGRSLSFSIWTPDVCTVSANHTLAVAAPSPFQTFLCGIRAWADAGSGATGPSGPPRWIRIGDGIFADAFE